MLSNFLSLRLVDCLLWKFDFINPWATDYASIMVYEGSNFGVNLGLVAISY